MDVKRALIDQYGAALEMLKQAIIKCPAARWNDAQDRKKFWQVAYHTLFYTHLYLHDGLKDFKPWAKHRQDYHQLRSLPEKVAIGEPYSREEVLEFFELCQQTVEDKVSFLDLEAESGFDWLPFSKLELQLYNIRHIQHHAAELIEWLGATQGIDVDWVGMAPAPP
jgi:hypothetical protein